jgi:uncharacterized delta-60 repeat protein
MHRRRKRAPELRQSRYVQPRLEALEDRFLPSGNPIGPMVTIASPNVAFSPLQGLVLPDGKTLLGMTIDTGQSLGMQYSGPVPPRLILGEPRKDINAMELVRLNADGTLDTSFGNGGVDILRPNLSDTFANFAVAADGSILVAGTEISSNAGYLVPSPFNMPNGDSIYDFVYQDSGLSVLRLNPDGSISSSFQAGNVAGFRVDTMGDEASVGAVAVQADGKVVVAGEGVGFVNSTIFVARYNTDGSFDTTFNAGGAQPGVATTSITKVLQRTCPISSIAVQSDGKIVVGGQDGDGGMVVLRYNADGSADTGFGTNGGAYAPPGPGFIGYLGSLAIQPDGKIVAAVSLSAAGPTQIGALVLVRLNTDGTYDSSFGQQGVVQIGTTVESSRFIYRSHWRVGGLTVEADGKIVVAGGTEPEEHPYDDSPGFVARINSDGSPDATFGPNGVQLTTLVANDSTSHTLTPLASGLAPDGSVRVVGMLDYHEPLSGTPGDPDRVHLALLDFQDSTTGAGDTASPAAGLPAAAPNSNALTSNALADAVFQLLASGGGLSNAGAVALPASTNPFVLPTTPPSTITPLPIPGVSQSAAVAGLSGGGGGLGNAIDDPLALTGEPDRIGDLVLAGDAIGPA